MKFFWEMLTFCREKPKKGRSKMSAQICLLPVSEVLDPLVANTSYSRLPLGPRLST